MCVISSTAGAEDAGDATSSQRDASRFTYARLYCTPDNQSHFGALTVELAKQNFAPPAALIYIGGNQQASSVFLGGIRGALGRRRPGEPSLPSYSCGSVHHCGRRRILDHNDRWRDEGTTPRRHGPSGRRGALQRTHHRSGRQGRIPTFHSLMMLCAGSQASHPHSVMPVENCGRRRARSDTDTFAQPYPYAREFTVAIECSCRWPPVRQARWLHRGGRAVERRPHPRSRISLDLSRLQSRVFSDSRLSCSFLPRPSAMAIFARPLSLK